jgi:hypothetical protein
MIPIFCDRPENFVTLSLQMRRTGLIGPETAHRVVSASRLFQMGDEN